MTGHDGGMVDAGDLVVDEGVLDGNDRRISLVAVTDENWREVADVAPRDDQRDFVAPTAARYLLLSMREGVWHSLGIRADDIVVGHVMWAWDDEDGMPWVGGLVVDAKEQGRGVGRAAMVTLLRWLFARPDTNAVRLSYQAENGAAKAMYAGLGFVETGLDVDDEVVAELTGDRAASVL